MPLTTDVPAHGPAPDIPVDLACFQGRGMEPDNQRGRTPEGIPETGAVMIRELDHVEAMLSHQSPQYLMKPRPLAV